MIKIIECPRDAMQGLHDFIATEDKIRYINSLLKVGFDSIDFGSFVSPKAIPQMRDTPQVLEALDLTNTKSKLLAIIANQRGAEEAAQYKQIQYLGYPFSISETFQLRNTNATLEESLERVMDIQEICKRNNKLLVIYISMGFGNPYGDTWNVEIVEKWVQKLLKLEIEIMSLSDTIGVSNPDSIQYLFSHLIPQYPQIEFGAHLHTDPSTWFEKIDMAFQNGCKRFDSAIRGFGGCPMAKDELIGNMATENLISYFKHLNKDIDIDLNQFSKSMEIAIEIFPKK